MVLLSWEWKNDGVVDEHSGESANEDEVSKVQ